MRWLETGDERGVKKSRESIFSVCRYSCGRWEVAYMCFRVGFDAGNCNTMDFLRWTVFLRVDWEVCFSGK